VRLRPDGTQETEYLCELDLAEERMSSRLGGSSLFDEFFSDFFGQTPSTGRVAAPSRQVERVDVTQFFSDATRELLQRAAQTALEWGSLDLDTDLLLHAALREAALERRVLLDVLAGAAGEAEEAREREVSAEPAAR
jgi:ATP-dependent Clp protease ATP-binding subunit ClpC